MPSQPFHSPSTQPMHHDMAAPNEEENDIPSTSLPEANPLSIMSEQRIRVLPGASDTAASFEFEAEDHTLGNALRWMIMKNPEVELCGYSIPHPSEEKMNLRIQTYDGTNVYDVLEKGFDDLVALCDVVSDQFTVARDMFATEKQT